MRKAITAMAMLALASCSLPTITPDGCVLFGYKDQSGNKYDAGLCGQDKYVVQWTNSDDYKLRVVLEGSEYIVMYYDAVSAIWLEWSSKSGISLDGAPDNVRKYL